MKKFKLLLIGSVIVWLSFGNIVNAQTSRTVFNFSFSDWQLSCVDDGPSISISGETTYLFTVTVNPKTGLVTRIHNNVIHADVHDTYTGEKYVYLDQANDNLGTWWPEWLGIQPTPPAEGTTVAATGIKIIGKGGVVYVGKFMIQFHLDAKLNVVVDFRKDWFECNF